MVEYTQQDRQFLLNLARKSIKHYLNTGKKLEISESVISTERLKQKRAAFVTLTQNGNLRGCIGSLEPQIPLYEEIIDKALSAAFKDSRFFPLAREELAKTKIHISILTVPEPLSFENHKELLQKLIPKKDGVILKKGLRSATYLPKVWEELSDKEEFLSSLCHKAGLSLSAWKEGIEVLIYHTIDFSE